MMKFGLGRLAVISQLSRLLMEVSALTSFLDRAVVEAPGDTSGVCAEAALPTCALLGCDARVAAVHSDPRVGRTDFLNFLWFSGEAPGDARD